MTRSKTGCVSCAAHDVWQDRLPKPNDIDISCMMDIHSIVVHRKNVVLINISHDVYGIFQCAAKSINHIKHSANCGRLFKALCEDESAEHVMLLFKRLCNHQQEMVSNCPCNYFDCSISFGRIQQGVFR